MFDILTNASLCFINTFFDIEDTSSVYNNQYDDKKFSIKQQSKCIEPDSSDRNLPNHFYGFSNSRRHRHIKSDITPLYCFGIDDTEMNKTTIGRSNKIYGQILKVV